jgi:protein-S-isoprenylcysteine O-methyltransferase Ste14
MNGLDNGASAALMRLKNTAASVTVVFLACTIYVLSPFNREAMAGLYGPAAVAVTGRDFMLAAMGTYACLLALYFLLQPNPRVSKSLRFFRLLARGIRAPAASLRGGLAPDDRLALLSTLLKSFFGPMMLYFLMTACLAALGNGAAIIEAVLYGEGLGALFGQHGFWFTLQAILFVDVLLFTVGYLVESPRLGNEIRSVDPTAVGWAAALLCYPPFNVVTNKVLGGQAADFPQFDDPTLHIALNVTLLMLMAIYASASVALGLKASNLTHRGIVSRGPYRVVRHPAYVCKNMAWWIGSAPAVSVAFGLSLTAGLQAVASVIAWTMLYVLRALTEEDHLRKVDGEYATYAAKVRHRFIPGLI